MAQMSLSSTLHEIGVAIAPGQTLRIPEDFHSWPPNRNLRAGMHAMLSPRVSEWTRDHQRPFGNQPWTHRCQGLTSDGEHWFISSNNSDFRGIYKFTEDFVFRDRTTFPNELGNHIGDIDYANGLIYASIERKPLGPRVAIFNPEPAFEGAAFLFGGENEDPPQNIEDLSWCAINPWNGYLYTSNYDSVDRVNAYHRENNEDSFTFQGSLHLDGPVLNAVQGGCFSQNGHLYLASHASEAIHAYSTLNGAFYGAFSIQMDKTFPKFEELEGIALWPIVVEGDLAPLHVILLDRDAISDSFDNALNRDDIFIKHIAVPELDNI